MRTMIYHALANDATLRSLGVDANAFYAGDIDTPDERPFVNLRWGLTQAVPSIGAVAPRQLAIWVHDTPNDYARIDAIIRRIKQIFAGLVGARHELGYITVIEWNGDSDDGKDDGHGTIFRSTGHSIIGSGG
jgi:hypothetical protein